jgi:hypothetical protein
MLVKVDVRDIISDHVNTLVNFATGKRSRADLILFFVLPVLVGGGMAAVDVLLKGSTADGLLSALAIFAGLLFNLLILIHGLLRSATDAPRFREEKRLIQEIYANISYAILVSLVAIVVLVACLFPGPRWAWVVGSTTTYALIINFLLTMLMVLRRVHIVLRLEFDRGHVNGGGASGERISDGGSVQRIGRLTAQDSVPTNRSARG